MLSTTPSNGTPNPGKNNPEPIRMPSGLRHRRPSGCTTQTLLDAAQTLETTLEDTVFRLLHWDDLPPWRRDNPSIHTGYRLTSNSFQASLRSLLYLHNESVNIWTHLLGAVCVVGLVAFLKGVVVGPRYATASDADAVVFACFFGGAFCCLGMSATFHMLCNHSEEVARWVNKLDYTGIVFLIVGSFVPALWYGFFCRTGWLTVYLGSVSYPLMVRWYWGAD
jgi:adiponectin receptor